MGSRLIAPSVGASSAGRNVRATSSSEGITSVASESTVRLTWRTASRFGPTNGSRVADRKTGSSTAALAAAAWPCSRSIVAVVATRSIEVLSVSLLLQGGHLRRRRLQMRVRLIAAPGHPPGAGQDQHPGAQHDRRADATPAPSTRSAMVARGPFRAVGRVREMDHRIGRDIVPDGEPAVVGRLPGLGRRRCAVGRRFGRGHGRRSGRRQADVRCCPPSGLRSIHRLSNSDERGWASGRRGLTHGRRRHSLGRGGDSFFFPLAALHEKHSEEDQRRRGDHGGRDNRDRSAHAGSGRLRRGARDGPDLDRHHGNPSAGESGGSEFQHSYLGVGVIEVEVPVGIGRRRRRGRE